MREKFKQALLDIITGPFTATNNLLWNAYKSHLRDINPESLPKNVNPLFAELVVIYESRFNIAFRNLAQAWDQAELKSNGSGYSWWDSKGFSWRWRHSWHNAERKPNEQEIYDMILRSDLLHNLQHPTAARIKKLLFEIIERMPKRVRK